MSGQPVKIEPGARLDPDRHLVVFTHIPKSGGTSFHAALTRLLGGRYLQLVPGKNNPACIDDLCGIGGHFPYESSNVLSSAKDRVYVTLIRSPVERFMSFYKHVQQHPYHHVAQAAPEMIGMPPLPFAQHLRAMKDPEMYNLQCAMICGLPDGPVDTAALAAGAASAQKAIAVVERDYTLCMLLAHQQQAIDSLAAMCGRPSIKAKRLNVAKDTAPVPHDPELVAYVKLCNAQDVALHLHISQQIA